MRIWLSGLLLLLAACAAPDDVADAEVDLQHEAEGVNSALRAERRGIGLAPVATLAPTQRVAPAHSSRFARRALAVTDQAITQTISFREVLEQIVRTGNAPGLDALTFFHQWWDTQRSGPGLGLGPHCDDGAPMGSHQGFFNGFPYRCNRDEGQLAVEDPFSSGDKGYVTLGMFNRFDLAASDGSDCGEYRIVFARRSGFTQPSSRLLINFEARLPNPDPTSGVLGCLPVAQFWRDLSEDDNLASRANKLREFSLQGLPGFAPAVHADHYGAGPSGGGQIRVDEFMSIDWQLREFKLARSCESGSCSLRAVPATDKVNPAPFLFSGSDARSSAFQVEFTNQVPTLATPDIHRFDYLPSAVFLTGETAPNQGPAGSSDTFSYVYQFAQPATPSAFRSAIQAKLTSIGSSLTPEQIVARAEALSCAGCHHESNGASLGGGITWPRSLGFTHIAETTEQGPDGPRFQISTALTDTFLPHRQAVLQAYLLDHEPPGECTITPWHEPNCCGTLVCASVAGFCPIYCPPLPCRQRPNCCGRLVCEADAAKCPVVCSPSDAKVW